MTTLYGLDIETDTATGGLNPAQSRIVAVAVSSASHEQVFDGDEAELLRQLDAHLAQLPDGCLVTWNGGVFDLPFLQDRAETAGVALGLQLTAEPRFKVRDPLAGHQGAYRARWYGHRHLDGYRLYRNDLGQTLGLSCGLKPMARLVGLPAVEVEIEQLHLLSSAQIAEYVTSDARLARQLVERRLPQALAAID